MGQDDRAERAEALITLCGIAVDVDGGSLLGWMPVERYTAKRRKKSR